MVRDGEELQAVTDGLVSELFCRVYAVGGKRMRVEIAFQQAQVLRRECELAAHAYPCRRYPVRPEEQVPLPLHQWLRRVAGGGVCFADEDLAPLRAGIAGLATVG